MKHALKIENINLEEKQANRLIEILKEFANELGYSQDRISDLECRRRDGFIPFSHNYGGIEAVAFGSQDYFQCEGTGFENADNTLEKYYEYDLENFEKENGPQDKWTEKQRDEFYEYRASDSEASILFSLDIMHQGIEKGIHSLNLRLCVCVKDAPYHRTYDDLIEVNLTFRTFASLERQLAKLLRRKDFKTFESCLREAY